MAQHVILNHPDVIGDSTAARDPGTEWHPRTKLFCFLGCAIGSWALVAAPFFLIG
tara:strand:- start:431 stop:595 length:165 start_codon:yes stop_codon:yes gene_type:complete